MSNILERCALLKLELDNLRPLSKGDELRIMQKFRLDWNYHSNHLEGNSLTFGEAKSLILFGITANGKPLRDHFEMKGHNDAINWVLQIVKEERRLNENFIRELHTLILRESYEVDAITSAGNPSKKKVNIGEYKTTPNHVKTITGEMFYFATPEETPMKMHDLVSWYNMKSDKRDVNPILLAAEFHYRYIRIHPFDDGNGRTARIIMNFILLKFGYPPVIVKTEDKENYFKALRQADAGSITTFIEYIATNLKGSLEIMIAGAKGEKIEEDDDIEKEIKLLEQSIKAKGKSIEITRNEESILKVYSDTIKPLANQFFDKSNAFENFYKLIDCKIKKNSTEYDYDTHREDSFFKDAYEIELNCYFKIFSHSVLSNFNYKSSLSFNFLETNFTISVDGTLLHTLLYNENLSENEMKSIVKNELKKHKNTIEVRLKE